MDTGTVLDGKIAIVTGAGRGIGRAIAELMADHGARVVVNDLGVAVDGKGGEERVADEVVAAIRARGGEAVASVDSVADWDGARAIVATARDAFGGLDIVVNNAGILRDAIFHKMSPEDWTAVLHTHLFGSFFVSRAAAEPFRAQERGAYVHMTSTTGLIGNLGQANYGAAKLGIAALSKAIALDMARFGVRSNCISPFAWSRMVGAIPNTPDQEERLARMRGLAPGKVAALAVYLASPLAEGVTGQIFAARGNEIVLMSQPRPLRSVHRGEDWSPRTIAAHAMPALRPSFYPLERTQDVFAWDPV